MTSIKEHNKKPNVKNTKTKKKKKKPNHNKKKINKSQHKTKKKGKHNQFSQTSGTKKKKNSNKPGGKKKKGYDLKVWLQKNGCFEIQLHRELLRKGVDSPESIKNLSENQFDTIVRKVRVDKFSQLKDTAARNRVDKLLVTFEKIWRKKSGNKKTNLKTYV
eukprot:521997_1